MKKIFTLALGLMLTIAMFAADRKPDVILSAPKKYEIVIDGKSYFSTKKDMNVLNLRGGFHTVKVYEMKQGFLFKSKKLVSTSSFRLTNNDIKIDVNRFGQVQISEQRKGRGGWDNDNRYDRDDKKYDRDHDRRF